MLSNVILFFIHVVFEIEINDDTCVIVKTKDK